MLNQREIKFCENVVLGSPPGQAYLDAGYKSKDLRIAQNAASRKLNHDQEIIDKVEELRKKFIDDEKLTLDERLMFLGEIVRGRTRKKDEEFLFDMPPTHRERIAAIVEYSKLVGDYAPEKKQVEMQMTLGDALVALAGNDFGTFSAEHV